MSLAAWRRPGGLLLALSLSLAPTWAQEASKDGIPFFTAREVERIRLMSALPTAPAPDPTNRVADLPAAARLGQALFYDRRLSADGQRSCATCHDPDRGWSDGRATAQGLARGRRNTPTLLGAAEQRWWFWDGRSDSQWAQALHPLEDPSEMGFSRTELLQLLASDESLHAAYREVFGELPAGSDNPQRFPPGARPRPPAPQGFLHDVSPPAMPAEALPAYEAWARMTAADQEAVNRVFSNCGKAIAAFERQLILLPSPFDRFAASLTAPGSDLADRHAISPAAQRGLKLFLGRGRCHSCHFTFLLSDREFHNEGLALPAGEVADHGRVDGIVKLELDPFNGRGIFSDARDWPSNVKLRYLFYDRHTYGAYKTPTLRNLGRTAPYMHDGRFATLEEVVAFYSELPGEAPVGHREETLVARHLSAEEQADLVAFLKSLDSPPLPEALRRPLPQAE